MTTKLLGAASNRRSLKTRQSPPACVKGERPLHVAVYCYSQNESEVRIKDELEFCGRFAASVLPEASIEHVVDIGRGGRTLASSLNELWTCRSVPSS